MSTEQRLRFLRENEFAVQTLVKKQGSPKGYVAIIADSRDVHGKDLAEISAEKAGADWDAHARKTLAKNEIPTVVFLLETDKAAKVVRSFAPGIADKLEKLTLPEGVLFTVVVSGGGSSLIAIPVDGPRPVGSA